MLDDQNLIATQFLTLWAMLDPVGHLSLFLGATAELTPAERRRAALIGVPTAFGILVFFGLAGQALLHAMGISLVSFQIAGGIILLVFSLTMVLGEPPGRPRGRFRPRKTRRRHRDLPLATPIIAGPGAMLAIIILTDNNRFTFEHQVVTLLVLGVVLGALFERVPPGRSHPAGDRHRWQQRPEAHHGRDPGGPVGEPDPHRDGPVAEAAGDLTGNPGT